MSQRLGHLSEEQVSLLTSPLPPSLPHTPFWPTAISGPAGRARRYYGGNNMRGDEARDTQVKTERERGRVGVELGGALPRQRRMCAAVEA